MKIILLVITLVLPSVLIFGQSDSQQMEVKKVLDETITTYQLTNDQIPKAEIIVAREIRNLHEIESLKTSDYNKYLLKKKGIVLATEGSLKRILTEEQMEVLMDKKVERRKRESALLGELKGQGFSKSELERKMLEMY